MVLVSIQQMTSVPPNIIYGNFVENLSQGLMAIISVS